MANNSAQKIMAVARDLVQSKGYNAFSFHEIARILGIKSASIHYYFPAKSDLGLALLRQYRQDLFQQLKQTEASADPSIKKLDDFMQQFLVTLQSGNRMCLCGMLASDIETMPDDIRSELRLFFNECEKWLAKIIRSGQTAGEIRNRDNPDLLAQFILAAMEGAMLSARTFSDPDRFRRITSRILTSIQTG